jgi:RimJ/RimL family protein N-acetyltransferase
MKVKIRPLQAEDAAISYKWRNNPEIWKYTESKPDRNITYEIELNWLRDVLKRPDEKRFAICVGDNNQYIGNVQLTNINEKTAQFHVFIGEIGYHGKGVGTKSTLLILVYAFSVLNLESIYLFVNKKNISAIKLYEKCGFLRLKEVGEVIKMEIFNERNQE